MLRLFRGYALVGLVALVGAGCGTGGLADSEAAGNGEQLFKEKCGGCHELQAAGTRGTVGPSLDAAFAAPREEDFDESSIREVVLGQMRFPIPPMPDDSELFPVKGDYTMEDREQDMEAIAAYVASVAGDEEAIAQARQQGGGAEGASDPKELFTGNCGGCHTLSAAGATGTVGPNLDQTQLELPAIQRQIRQGGGGMPPFEGTLSDEQIQALAKYVRESRKG